MLLSSLTKKKITAKYGENAKEKIFKEARTLAKLKGHMHVVDYKEVDETTPIF